MKKPKVVLIAGPTGVGKTAASVLLAKKLNTDVISCDSMQIYKGMDIGTAKVTKEEAMGVVHHMTDIIEPYENFSVSDYALQASVIIDRLSREDKISLLVGGTGLYADTLLKGIEFAKDASGDSDFRERMTQLSRERGAEYLHSLLAKCDPESAQNIHPNNIKRVIRALEYHHLTGEKISEHNKRTQSIEAPYDSVRIYFTRSRENLYNRIDKRVDEMMRAGLKEEVEALMQGGLDLSSTAMQAIGYKEIARCVSGEISSDEAAELIKLASRHYAKRQLTWFKRDKEGIWLNLDEIGSAEDTADRCFEIIKERKFL